jgi:hypothetical protein
VVLTLTRLSAEATRPPGVSQYSAVSPVTLSTTTEGSSGPCGNHPSICGDHSSAAFAGSSTTSALPFTEIQTSREVSATPTCGLAVIWATLRESREERNQRLPSKSVSC